MSGSEKSTVEIFSIMVFVSKMSINAINIIF